MGEQIVHHRHIEVLKCNVENWRIDVLHDALFPTITNWTWSVMDQDFLWPRIRGHKILGEKEREKHPPFFSLPMFDYIVLVGV